jgi:hypothetical protein
MPITINKPTSDLVQAIIEFFVVSFLRFRERTFSHLRTKRTQKN